MTGILFDASRLVFRTMRGGALTGIDRVVLAYGRWLASRPDVDLKPVWCCEGRLLPVAPRLFQWMIAPDRAEEEAGAAWPALVAALGDPRDDAPALRAGGPRSAPHRSRIVQAIGEVGLPPLRVKAAAGDLYVNVSHYGVGQGDLLRRLAARRIRPVVMLHDLIPLLHPEFCTPGGALKHRLRMEAVAEHGALVIANSASTAQDVSAWAQAAGRAAPQVVVAPLGIESAFGAPVEPVAAARPYFVCVGTIEPRKNLAFLLSLWGRLADRLGAAAPRLVLVGRRGWENEAVIDLLERAPAVRRLAHEVCDLSDGQLARLIAGAQALLAPSFAEGFNLPVAEALALGAPVLASDIPVHRELAPTARLIDPLDGMAWLEAIEAATLDPQPRRPRPAPTWEGHFEVVARALGLEQGAPARSEQPAAAVVSG
jgi:glycosyltransferase involved in cell wall biosynthesis